MKPVAPDDMKVGQIVAVIYRHTDCQCCFCAGRHYDGLPLEILAISWPFVMVFDGTGTYSIDVRVTQLVRLERNYVRKCKAALYCDEIDDSGLVEDKTNNPRLCPRCSSKLRDHWMSGVWGLKCGECGFEGK